jgi:predicted nucleotidyltransferase
MLFKERNNPFGEVIQPPDSIRHPISMILSNHSTTEESLQRVKQLNVTSMLNDGEFGEYLKLAGHLGVWIDADVETTFAVNKSHHPLSF